MSSKNFTIILLIFFFFLFFAGCNKSNNSGIIGIEVPVGSGKVSEDTPYLISGVFVDSPAYKAGLKPDDIIVQIDNKPIEKGMKFDYIYNSLLRGKAGTKLTIVVLRNNKKKIFRIVRGKRE